MNALLLCAEDDGDALDDAIARLCVPDRERLATIGSVARRREFVLARRLVTRACRDVLGGNSWRLVGARGRRPIAQADDGRTHAGISLSHSRGAVACVVADAASLAIGCDLEQVRARADSSWRRLADLERTHPVFSKVDREWVLTHVDDQIDAWGREARLALLWVCKEAVAKADGAGIFRARLPSVRIDAAELSRVLRADAAAMLDAQREEQHWHLHTRRLAQHWLAVAAPIALHVQSRVLAASELYRAA